MSTARTLRCLAPAAVCCLGLLLVSGDAQAKCADGGLSVWPSSGTRVPPTFQLVLEEHRGSEDFRAAVIEARPALVSGLEIVPLEVTREFEGRNLRQLVLVPSRPLQVDRGYELKFTQQDPNPRLWFRSGEPPHWSVEEEENQAAAAPSWASGLTQHTSSFDDSFACDTTANVVVSVGGRSSTALAAVVKLVPFGPSGKPDDGAWPRSMIGPVIFPVERGNVIVGHEQCAGGLDVTEFARYRMAVALIDAAGRTSATTQTVDFDSPNPPARSAVEAFVPPLRKGAAKHRVRVRLDKDTSARAEQIIGDRLRRLGLEMSAPRRKGRVLEFRVVTASDAKEWMPQLLRPGVFEVAPRVTFVADRLGRLPPGFRVTSDGRLESDDPGKLNHFLRARETSGDSRLRAWCFDGNRGLARALGGDAAAGVRTTCEAVAVGGPVATNSAIAGARAVTSQVFGSPVARAEVEFSPEASNLLTSTLGRRPYALLLDGHVVGIASQVRLPFSVTSVDAFEPITGPADVLVAVLESGPLAGVEVLSVEQAR